VIRERVEFGIGGKPCDALLFRPEATGRNPAIVHGTDIYGVRPSFERLATRLAEQGYAVLLPNIYYRSAPMNELNIAPPQDMDANEAKKRVPQAIRTPLVASAIDADTCGWNDFLAGQGFVDPSRMGYAGYCMTGVYAMRIAALRPDNVVAAASIHGGNLATDEPDSPHLLLPKIAASLYFGHAMNDRTIPAEMILKLEHALKQWGGRFISDTYPALHGWMVDDRPNYHAVEAERCERKLFDVFADALL
jgi:carboxymethylenebutenolidase